MNLRIVAEKRGDLVLGFRVQKKTYRRRYTGEVRDDNRFETEYGPGWGNIGRKCYSLVEAREYRDFLIRHENKESITLDVVEDSSSEKPSLFSPIRSNY